jgi:DnaK suppressor protein
MALSSTEVAHYRQILIARRDELASATARSENSVADADDLAHRDEGDRAIADNAKDELLDSASRDSEELQQIEDALARVAQGKYGICQACGQDIAKSRLDAAPWAVLCVRDQEIADERNRHNKTMTGGVPSRVVS